MITGNGMDNSIIDAVGFNRTTEQMLATNVEHTPGGSYHVYNATNFLMSLPLGDLGKMLWNTVTFGAMNLESSGHTWDNILQSGALDKGGAVFVHSQGADLFNTELNQHEGEIGANVFYLGGAQMEMPTKRFSNGGRVYSFDNNDMVPSLVNTPGESIYNKDT